MDTQQLKEYLSKNLQIVVETENNYSESRVVRLYLENECISTDYLD